ncbi:MAG TPA: alpha/beta hydrolase [Chitinophagaceae bacterium]|nr:alpha/beta hydrolase [Chitinophagaceae bacterium]MCC6633895.1 alpha/beta hydrolase [Chitinophagaceae bacterium]HMZ45644.1 alpha/beta hydrolase [Chitinophagaceae bacterium]HNE92585.1 alpha/beta hydrolase [Chitinophagaceae bacterium]HNJ58690.1 alpha/beta hydrolase [Chitinophagaceae bacterium]
MQQSIFNYKGHNIAYTIYGSGKPLVLLHGFGEDSTIFNNQVNYLKNNFQVIVPDLPGSGNSSLLKLRSVIEINKIMLHEAAITDYANCIAALLNFLAINECILLGHSMGGYITLAFAEKFPNYLKAFGLLHSTAFEDNEIKKENRMQSIAMIEEYGAFSFLKNVIPNYFGKKFSMQQAPQINKLIDKSAKFTNEALQQYYFAMMNRPDRTEVLKDASVPVLFIIGTEDVPAPMKDVLQQVHLPQKSYVHIFDEVGHMSMVEATDKLNKSIEVFCKDIFQNLTLN